MPHDPVNEHQTVIEKDAPGQHDMVVLRQYEAPSDGDGNIAHDEFKARDAAVSSTMMKWLQREYPGYPWGCVADLAHGIVKFNIPILMGLQNWWVINLRTHPNIVEELARGAGQILERYRLRRGRFELAAFLEAREKHSALIVPKRLVPE